MGHVSQSNGALLNHWRKPLRRALTAAAALNEARDERAQDIREDGQGELEPRCEDVHQAECGEVRQHAEHEIVKPHANRLLSLRIETRGRPTLRSSGPLRSVRIRRGCRTGYCW